MLKKLIAGAVVSMASISFANAGLLSSSVYTNFNELIIATENGDLADDIVSGGITFSSTLPLALFEANCNNGEINGTSATCSGPSGMGGDDGDLAIDSMGSNVSNPILIINEDATIAGTGPDDSRFGGTISVALPISVVDATLEFVDVNSGSVEFLLGGMAIGMADIPSGEDNEVTSLFFDGGIFDSLNITLVGSGGLVSAHFTPVPVPAALPLFLSGLGLLALGRRKAAAQ